MTSTSFVLLQIAAWLHLLQVPGTWYLARRVVGIADELERVSRLVAAILGVLGVAVVTVLVALGVLIGSHSAEVLGTGFGRSLVLFLAGFWLARLGVQFWYYFGLPWPRTRSGKVAHWTLAAIFAAQALGYAGAWLAR